MKGTSPNTVKLQNMRRERGHTFEDMLRALNISASQFKAAYQTGGLPALIERYGKIAYKRPTMTHAECMERLREIRKERNHNFTEMCRSIDIPESAYQRLRNAGRLEDVVREYEKVRPSAAPPPSEWANLTDEEIGRKMLRDSQRRLPPVGSVLQRGDQKATVLRHTSADSILVEWRDGEGKTRRAEWTTTPHPRCTDRGDWRVQK